MEKTVKMIIMVVMIAGFVVPAAAFEDYQDNRGRRESRRRPPQNAGMLIGKVLHDAMVSEALAEMTGKPAEIKMIPMSAVRNLLNINLPYAIHYIKFDHFNHVKE